MLDIFRHFDPSNQLDRLNQIGSAAQKSWVTGKGEGVGGENHVANLNKRPDGSWILRYSCELIADGNPSGGGGGGFEDAGTITKVFEFDSSGKINRQEIKIEGGPFGAYARKVHQEAENAQLALSDGTILRSEMRLAGKLLRKLAADPDLAEVDLPPRR